MKIHSIPKCMKCAKLVRLKLTGDIVPVERYTSTSVTIIFKEHRLIMELYQISEITAEEQFTYETKLKLNQERFTPGADDHYMSKKQLPLKRDLADVPNATQAEKAIPESVIRMNALAQFLAVIWLKHRSRAVLRETVFVHEMTKEKETIWKGDVGVFDLGEQHKAKACYAWQFFDPNGNAKLITVLASRAIDSPNKAVEVAIFDGSMAVSPALPNVDEAQLKKDLEKNRQLVQEAKILSEDLGAAVMSAHLLADEFRRRNR